MKIQFCQADKRPKIRVSGVSFGPNRKLARSEEHTSELQSRLHLVCRLLLEKKKTTPHSDTPHLPLAPSYRPLAPHLPHLSTPSPPPLHDPLCRVIQPSPPRPTLTDFPLLHS